MLPDTVVGHYRVIAPLGKGGMGEVYAAEDTKLKRTVALKILPKAADLDPDRRTRFEREAQAIAALNRRTTATMWYAAQRQGRADVFERSLAGGPERQVTHFPRDDSPLIFSGALSRDGRLAVVRGNSRSDVVLIEAPETPSR